MTKSVIDLLGDHVLMYESDFPHPECMWPDTTDHVIGWKDVLGEERYGVFKKSLDLGDIIGVTGALFRTKTGEVTVRVDAFTLLSKSLRPLPEKWHGLKDVERRYRQRVLALIALPIALAMMLYATTIPAAAEELVPALQNNLLLSVHVAVAIVAYGTFSVAFGAAVLHLLQPAEGRRGLPRPELLDEIGYRAVVIGFPFLTLVIVLGAVWIGRASCRERV